MIVLLCPGQGAQRPGMLKDWLAFDGIAELVDEWSEAVGLDLAQLGTTADAETIKDTAVTQPLLVVTALASFEVWRQNNPDVAIGAVAGHSVGEFAAAAIAGMLTPFDAMAGVAARGRAMARCAAAKPSSMTAVVGGDPTAVVAAIERAGAQAANFNGPGQIVAGGSLEALQRLAQNPPPKARVVPLEVAGAFHTEFMTPARGDLTQAMAGLATGPARFPVLANADGQPVTAADQLIERLIAQVDSPVRWDLVQTTIAGLAPEAIVELAPAGVLAGLAKLGLKGVPAVQVTPEVAGVAA